MTTKKLLTEPEVLDQLGIAHATFIDLRARHNMPIVRIGSRGVRYRPQDVDWLIKQMTEIPGRPGPKTATRKATT